MYIYYRVLCVSRYAVSMLNFPKAYRIMGANVGNNTSKLEFKSGFEQE